MTNDEKRRWKGPGKSQKKGSGRRVGERKVTAYNASSESSKRWIERQLSDPYVQKAKKEGYRARAAYKLKEIDEKASLLRAGICVVDLGCAPGGWLQVLQETKAAEIAGIDLLPVEPLSGVHIIEGDINNADHVGALLAGLTRAPDLVLSDMAANTTGHRQTDHLRTSALADLGLDFAEAHLVAGGAFCSKVFQGGATADMLDRLKDRFQTVKHIKPAASRAGSPEIYVVAKGFKGRAREE
ncbi:MAG: RlmE family RNA methyltransferase [Pseudomonadota bacterium]